jgi:hypothetical protein
MDRHHCVIAAWQAGPIQATESAMNECDMNWSDAIRARSAALCPDSMSGTKVDAPDFGTLGKALWVQRCLASLFRLRPAVNAHDAQVVVADLGSTREWLKIEPERAAVRLVTSSLINQ